MSGAVLLRERRCAPAVCRSNEHVAVATFGLSVVPISGQTPAGLLEQWDDVVAAEDSRGFIT